MKTYTSRRDIPAAYTWNLTDIYPTDEAWEAAFAAVQGQLPTLESFKGTLGQSGQRLLDCLQTQDKVFETIECVYRYASMHKDEDTTNSLYQGMVDRAKQQLVAASAAVAYVEPEILTIPEATLAQFIAGTPGLQGYQHAFDNLARQRPHLRTAEIEALLAASSEMASASSDIFGMINDADLQLPKVPDEQGKKQQLTLGSYQKFIHSPDRAVRKAAFEALHNTFLQQKNTLATAYAARIKADIFYTKQRGYDSSLERALSASNIPATVYSQLIDTVHQHLPLLARYLRLRKKLLGVDQLHLYDVYVPMVKEVEREFSFEQAADTVQKALAPLGKDYGEALSHAFSDRWIDVFETPGKRSGAYCSFPPQHPYILTNFQGNRDGVYTLAHELGHAMHSYYFHKAQPYHYASCSIFTTEVASTANEGLLTDYLLKTTTDTAERIAILNHALEDIRATLFRQTMFAEFEKLAHEQAEAGKALTAESLSADYHQLVSTYFSPEVAIDPAIDIEWARIPHFYKSFYVYQYATGVSAATALVQQILQEGQPAVDRYLGFLQAGASDYSIELLKKAGVDMTTAAPIQQTFQLFESYLDQLEKLVSSPHAA